MSAFFAIGLSTAAALAGLFISPYVEREEKKQFNPWIWVLIVFLLGSNAFAGWQQWEAQRRDAAFVARELRVLWVDDNPKTKGIYSEIETHGGKVAYTGTNEEALHLLKENEFTHVVSDIFRLNMDGPTAGLELLDQIRKVNSSIPVIIFSREADRYEDEVYRRGANLVTASSSEAMLLLLGIRRSN